MAPETFRAQGEDDVGAVAKGKDNQEAGRRPNLRVIEAKWPLAGRLWRPRLVGRRTRQLGLKPPLQTRNRLPKMHQLLWPSALPMPAAIGPPRGMSWRRTSRPVGPASPGRSPRAP